MREKIISREIASGIPSLEYFTLGCAIGSWEEYKRDRDHLHGAKLALLGFYC
jgi:hypothetical protein